MQEGWADFRVLKGKCTTTTVSHYYSILLLLLKYPTTTVSVIYYNKLLLHHQNYPKKKESKGLPTFPAIGVRIFMFTSLLYCLTSNNNNNSLGHCYDVVL